MDWVQTSSFHADLGSPFGVLDRTMPDVGPAAGLYFYVFGVFEPPISEVPTYKRVKYVVESASGAATEYQAADKVSQALAALPDGPQDTCDPGQEWKLLDGEVQGLCDDQAVLMKRCLDVIGVPADTTKLFPCKTWATLYSQTTRPYKGPPVPSGQGWLVFPEVLSFRHGLTGLEYWEGVCHAANHTWATYPLHHEPDDQEFHRWLRRTPNGQGWQQWWWRPAVIHDTSGAILHPATWLEGPIPGPN